MLLHKSAGPKPFAWRQQAHPPTWLKRRTTSLYTALQTSGATGHALEQWLTERGGIVSKVQLTVTPSERRLLVTEVIRPGDIMVSVPRDCQLRYDNVTDPRLLNLFEQLPRGSSNSNNSAWQFLQGLALLWHLAQGTKSPLHSYIALLPGLAPGVPTPRVGMLISDEAVQELQYMPLVDDILNQKYWWDMVWSKTLPEVRASEAGDPFNGMEVSREAFGWAVAVTNSRTFGLSRAGTHTMTPLIDMVDHDAANSNCEVSSDWEGTVQLCATKQMNPGDTLYLSYGRHDSRNLLLSYGFVPQQGTPWDRFEFDFDLDSMMALASTQRSSAQLTSWQRQVLVDLGLVAEAHSMPSSNQPDASAASQSCQDPEGTSNPGPAAAATATAHPFHPRVALRPAAQPAAPSGGKPAAAAQPVDPRLLAALRVMLLSGKGESAQAEEALVASLTRDKLGDWSQPLGRQHELEVLALLTRLCTALYQGLGSTLQQDRVLQRQLQDLLAGMPASMQPPNGLEAPSLLSGLDLHHPDASRPIRDALLAVQYRISIKSCLEGALQAVITRRKELSS